jgi:hypothetical protein
VKFSKIISSFANTFFFASLISLSPTLANAAFAGDKLPWDSGIQLNYSTYPGHKGQDFGTDGRTNINARATRS